MFINIIKILTLICIALLVNACDKTVPGTYDGPGTEISGKILDKTTLKPISGVQMSVPGYHLSQTGDFRIPRYASLPITTLKDGPWGSHRYFIVSKQGYMPMLCICDMRHINAYAVILLSRSDKNIDRMLKDVGVNVSCIPYIDPIKSYHKNGFKHQL